MMRRIFYILLAMAPFLACLLVAELPTLWMLAAYISGTWATIILGLERDGRR